MRYYDPQSGKILIDGVALPDTDPQAVRARISTVPQDVVIFATSIRENIAFGRPGASDEEIVAAAKRLLRMISSWRSTRAMTRKLANAA